MTETKFKLKLNTSVSSQPPAGVQTAHPTGLRLNFTPKPSSATATAPKSAFPSGGSGKKRNQRETDPSAPASASKKPKAILRLNTPTAAQNPPLRKGSIIKLKKSATLGDLSPTTPGGTFRPALKLKHRGKIPPRPLGAGYDSECSDAEEDPAIEENFILRMQSGEDADLIRQAIEEKKIGIPVKDGGADVSMKFFTRDARRACIRVQDRYYGAVLVDLPCVVETMKSWDKKGWWKSADVSQMLVVTGRVENEDQARTVEVPKEADPKTMAWPHGLTPPMYDVRRRRFRKRVSHRTIEQAEEEVERLLAADSRARERGGVTMVESMTWDDFRRQEDGIDGDEPVDGQPEDAEGDYDDEDMEGDDANEDEGIDDDDDDDDDDLMAQFEAQLGAGEPDMTNVTEPTQALATPATAAHKAEHSNVPEKDKPKSGDQKDEMEVDVELEEEGDVDGSVSGSGSDEEDEDDNEDEEDEEEEEESEDEEAKERREQKAQLMEEIAHIEEQIAEKKKQLGITTNPLFRQRLLTTIHKFEEDKDVKKRAAGLSLDDENEDE